MILQQININLLYIFIVVYRTKNMTIAAEQLNITQSGVSQHIKNLEAILEVGLFDRINKKIVPTKQAKELFIKWSKIFDELELSLGEVGRGALTITGTLNIACPIEFGNSFVLPKIAQFQSKNPSLKIKIFYGHATHTQKMITEGSLDMAFFDNFDLDPEIELVPVFEETLELCASKKYLDSKKIKKSQRQDFTSFNYISYLENAPVLTQWFKHHFKGKKMNLNIAASLMDVQGVETMIMNHMGVGVLPHYRLNALGPLKKSLHIFNGPKGKLKNTISLAYLKNRQHDFAAQEMINYFTTSFAK